MASPFSTAHETPQSFDFSYHVPYCTRIRASSFSTDLNLFLVIPLILSQTLQVLRIILRRSTNGISQTASLLRLVFVSCYLSYLIVIGSGPLGDLDCLRVDGKYYESRWGGSGDVGRHGDGDGDGVGAWRGSGSLVGILVVGVWLICEGFGLAIVLINARHITLTRKLTIPALLATILLPILSVFTIRHEKSLERSSTLTSLLPTFFTLFLLLSTILLAFLQLFLQRQAIVKSSSTPTSFSFQLKTKGGNTSISALSLPGMVLQGATLFGFGISAGYRALQITELLSSPSPTPSILLIVITFLNVAIQPFIIAGGTLWFGFLIWKQRRDFKSAVGSEEEEEDEEDDEVSDFELLRERVMDVVKRLRGWKRIVGEKAYEIWTEEDDGGGERGFRPHGRYGRHDDEEEDLDALNRRLERL